MLWVRILIRERCTTLCDKVCQWLATGRWFSLGPPVSSINKTDCHDITEILLKVALNTIKQTNKKLDESVWNVILLYSHSIYYRSYIYYHWYVLRWLLYLFIAIDLALALVEKPTKPHWLWPNGVCILATTKE